MSDKIILFWVLITFFSMGYMLGYRKGIEKSTEIDVQDDVYTEQYLIDHNQGD